METFIFSLWVLVLLLAAGFLGLAILVMWQQFERNKRDRIAEQLQMQALEDKPGLTTDEGIFFQRELDFIRAKTNTQLDKGQLVPLSALKKRQHKRRKALGRSLKQLVKNAKRRK